MGVHIIPAKDKDGNVVQKTEPFSSRATPDGVLYKHVAGVMSDEIADTATVNVDYPIAIAKAKFSGAEILNVSFGDRVDFTVHDTADNYFSGLDPQVYGPHVEINKFGYQVVMPDGGYYKNTSQYDATLYQGMILRCTYTNNSGASKKIGFNPELHEVRTQ